MTMMMKTGQEAMARRADGATQTQPKGGVAAVGGVTSAACSGEAVSGEAAFSAGVDRLSPLSLRKLVTLQRRLMAGESLHIAGAAGLISWRQNRRPGDCLYLVTDFYTGGFLAWLTEAEKKVLDEVLPAGRSGQECPRSSQGDESDAAQRVPTRGKEVEA